MRHPLHQPILRPTSRAVAGAFLLLSGQHLHAAAIADAALEPDAAPMATVVVQGEADTIARRSAVGSKGDAAIVEVPQSISVLNRDRLDAQRAPGIPQALRYTAGMQTESYGVDPRFDQYMIRGFETGSNGVFRDGLNLPTRGFTGFTLEPYGLESLEVLRGPSSVLYGQAEVGGMVNAVSKRPTAGKLREVELSYGSFDRKQVAADVGGALDEQGQWLYRVTLLAREAGSAVDHTRDNRQYLAPALTWQPDANTSLTLLAYLQNDDLPPNFYLPAEGTRTPGPFGRIPASRFVGEPGVDHFKTAQHSIGYRFERRMAAGWMVRQNVRYATETVDYHSLYMTTLHDDGRTVDRTNFSSQQKARVLSADQNIEWRSHLAGLENTLVAGLDYSRAVQDGQNYLGAAPTLDIITPLYGQAVGEAALYQDQRSTLRQIGVYVQDQLKFDGQYLLTVGGRHDRSRTSSDDRFNASQSNQTDHAGTGRVGLTWLGPDGLAPYLSYASSFRPVLGQSADGRAFVPEQGRQVELGVKWAPLDRAALLSAAVFNLRKDNVLTADPLHMETGAQIQRGQVRVRGLELEADVKLDKSWKANASLTALDAKITRNNDGNQGNRPSLVPRMNLAGWVERTFGDGWRGGLGVRRIGATYGDDANTFENPGVTLADAMFGYRQGQWDFVLNVSNLSDKIYLGNCASDGTCIYAARRQAQLTARYVW